MVVRLPYRIRYLIAALSLTALASGADGVLVFNRDIRPIFSDRCYACHGPDARQRQAGLRLDSESSAKSALKSGNVPVVPGSLSKSALYQRIISENKALRMPPAYSGRDALTAGEIETIRRWIEQGATWQ